MKYAKKYVKLKRITPVEVDNTYDVTVQDKHRLVANGFYTSNCWHPDVIEFIKAKQTPGRLTKFNISVNCTDDFMEKVNEGSALIEQGVPEKEVNERVTWNLRFPDTRFEHYKNEWFGDLKLWEEKGYPTETYRTVGALWLWNLIMESTYNRAEPGVLFLDRANALNPLNYKDTIYASNPCAEQVLAPGGVCDLGSLNLTQFVNEDNTDFDYDKLDKYTRFLVRFLDNVNDLSEAPLPEYKDFMTEKRRIGVGVLGWASSLYMMKKRFGSKSTSELREKLMKMISHTCVEASIDLAEEKGMFEACEPEKHAASPYFKQIDLDEALLDRMRKVGIRNSSLLSVQPTGNSAILANVVSGGIEPVFMQEYIRTVIVNHVPKHIIDVTPRYYEGVMEETEMFKWVKEGDEDILRGVDEHGTVYKIDTNRGLTKEVLCEDYGVRFMRQRNEWDAEADWAVTTMNLTTEDHLNDLKGFAKYVDSAISKTVNVPKDYSFDQFKSIYRDAYDTGYIKGITTYRAGTMTTVLSAKEEKDATDLDEEIILDSVKLPNDAPARMKTLMAEGKKWYLTVVSYPDSDRPFALFAQTNHHEKTASTSDALDRLIGLARRKGLPEEHVEKLLHKMSSDNNVAKICRAISLNLRHGVLIKNIVSELDKMEDVYVGSFLFQIKKYLGQYIKDGEKVVGAVCQSCSSSNIVFSEGCQVCADCGSSKCG